MTTIREIERPAGTIGRHPRTPRAAGTLGDRLTRRRLELGLTQREVGQRADLHPGHVRALEIGATRRNPEVYTLAALARALGVSLDWLWFGDES